jgi:hypothetical protein
VELSEGSLPEDGGSTKVQKQLSIRTNPSVKPPLPIITEVEDQHFKPWQWVSFLPGQHCRNPERFMLGLCGSSSIDECQPPRLKWPGTQVEDTRLLFLGLAF